MFGWSAEGDNVVRGIFYAFTFLRYGTCIAEQV